MNNEKKQLLTRQIIVKKLLEGKLFFTITSIPFLLIGIYMFITKIDSTDIAEIITLRTIAFLMIAIPLFVIINTYKKYKELMENANYVITIDILKEKECVANSVDENKHMRYYLYFKDYFKMYNKKIRVDFQTYRKVDIDEQCYLIFAPKYGPVFFKENDYELVEADKIIKANKLSDYINVKKIDPKKTKETINIDKEQIISDIKKDEISSILISILTTIITACVTVLVYFTAKTIVMIPALLTILILCIPIYKIARIIFIITKLKKDEYNIKTDKVIAIDKNIKFKDSNKFISFTFENFNSTVKTNRNDFSEVTVEEELYLVFVKGITSPIKVYQKKHSTLLNK